MMRVQTLGGESFGANCYLAYSKATRRSLVIDPGIAAERILAALDAQGLSIALIVLTHAHLDHFSALDRLRKETGAPFAAFRQEDAEPAEPRLILPGLQFTPCRLPYPPDRVLDDGEVLCVDDIRLTVLHTPGHSNDSISLHGHGVVFSGDTLMRRSIGIILPGLFPGHDHRTLRESINRRLLSLPDATRVYPGHGPATTIGEERRGNPMLENGGERFLE